MIFENNSNCYDLDLFTKLKKINLMIENIIS